MELLITIIVLALIFDYINGFHDAANAIATIVSTKVLTPLQAVIWAAFFNFLAFFIAKYLIGDFGIANTVSKTVYEQYSHHLEPVDLVERNSFFFIPYTYRRVCGSRHCCLWIWCHSKFGYPENRAFHFSGSSHRYACSLPLHSDSAESVP